MEYLALSEMDRDLLDRCLMRKSHAWEDFVDRFMGLVLHVIDHTLQVRCMRLAPQDRETLCAIVFTAIADDDFHLLRHFRGQASLATYLTVLARRIIVKQLTRPAVAPHGRPNLQNALGAVPHRPAMSDNRSPL